MLVQETWCKEDFETQFKKRCRQLLYNNLPKKKRKKLKVLKQRMMAMDRAMSNLIPVKTVIDKMLQEALERDNQRT